MKLKFESKSDYLRKSMEDKECVINELVKKFTENMIKDMSPKYVGIASKVVFNETVGSGKLVGVIGETNVTVSNNSPVNDKIHVKIIKVCGDLVIELC